MDIIAMAAFTASVNKTSAFALCDVPLSWAAHRYLGSAPQRGV
jgi:hypothetical protein